MANSSQNDPAPSGKSLEVTAPRALVPLMKAFHVDSDKTAKALIEEAAGAIYGCDDFGRRVAMPKRDLDLVASLMKGIAPRDMLETLLASQIIVSHMLGLSNLSLNHSDDQRLGLDLLRFSAEALRQLEKKRSGGIKQQITVNYLQTPAPPVEVIDANSGS